MNLLNLQVIEILALYLGSAIALSFCISFFFKLLRLKKWYEHHLWIGTFLKAVERPVQWVIWSSASIYLIQALSQWMNLGDWSHHNDKWLNLNLLISFSWVILNWKEEIEEIIRHNRHFEQKTSFEKATTNALGRLISIMIIVISGLTALQIIGVPIESLLAIGAVGAAGIAWASTDVVKNFFGGLMIHITRPFGTGDWINSPEKDIEGVVEEIGWYQTRIRTFEKRPIYVPNGLFTSIVLGNPSRMSNRRIMTDIGVRYEDMKAVPEIVKEIEKMLLNNPDIDQEQTLMVHFTNFNSYSLGINIYCFTKTTSWSDWRQVQQDVFFRIARIIDDHGAEITLPSHQLYVKPSRAQSFLEVASQNQ